MTSPRKLAANRRNALQSTGPRTAAGKARSARNNRPIHGLLAREALLSTENRRDFERLAEAVREDCKPEGGREHYFVERMITAEWRLTRVLRMEADILSWKPRQDPIGGAVEIYEAHHFDNVVNHFHIPDNHRGPTRKPEDADKGSAPAEETPRPVGLQFLQGCGSGTDAFARLLRHETAIERSYYRAYHELQRLQHARLGGYVPAPPLTVNLTVSAGADEEPHNAIDNAIAAPGVLETGAGEGARPEANGGNSCPPRATADGDGPTASRSPRSSEARSPAEAPGVPEGLALEEAGLPAYRAANSGGEAGEIEQWILRNEPTEEG